MIVGVLQARCSSRRLPGKVLAPILGKPMILRQIERLQRAGRIDRLVVATSSGPSDNPIARICADTDLDCYRGNLEDVLDRVLQAAGSADDVVRLTADCPLTDPEIVDRVIATHVSGHYDYTSNTLKRTYPDGLDVEVIRATALASAASEATLPGEREHVTPFLYNHPERFKLGSVTSTVDNSALRWTVDEQADIDFVRAVYAELYSVNPKFTTTDVLNLLERRPELVRLNEHLVSPEDHNRPLSQELK